VAGTLRDHMNTAEQVPGQTVIRSRANPINAQGAMLRPAQATSRRAAR